MNLKDIIKDNSVAFDHYRAGNFYYRITTPHKETFLFPVPLEEVGDATLHSHDKAIMFMRYIRKAISENTFILEG